MPEPIWHPADPPLEEQLGSPAWSFSTEKVSVTRKWRGRFGKCLANIPPVGGFLTGQYTGLRIVAVDVVQVEKGDIGELSFKAEGLLKKPDSPDEANEQPLPPDDVSLTFTQQEYAMQKHPRYSTIPDDILSAIDGFVHGASATDREEHRGAVEHFYIGADDFELAVELADKLKRGEDHYAMWVPVYSWTQSFLIEPPVKDAGGRIETPYGPVLPPSGMQFLRRGDEVKFTGEYWQLVRSWIASPVWDATTYPVREFGA